MEEILEQFGFIRVTGCGNFYIDFGDLRCYYWHIEGHSNLQRNTPFGVLNSYVDNGHRPFVNVNIYSEKQLAILLEGVL